MSFFYVTITSIIDEPTNININDGVGRCKKITPST